MRKKSGVSHALVVGGNMSMGGVLGGSMGGSMGVVPGGSGGGVSVVSAVGGIGGGRAMSGDGGGGGGGGGIAADCEPAATGRGSFGQVQHLLGAGAGVGTGVGAKKRLTGKLRKKSGVGHTLIGQ